MAFPVHSCTKLKLQSSPSRIQQSSGSRHSCRAMAAGGGTITREVLSKAQRSKMDGTSDRQFYAFPRLVKHVDDGFLAQVTQLYRERIQPGRGALTTHKRSAQLKTTGSGCSTGSHEC
eukprot:GHRQ01013143.1.p1 GENE.GHRQ01013143.1~~GHRQ01013143.1.p1  ORF type:complete len:118 (+),score=18.23 GHRQ01013143.1:832-1185(+)